MVSTSSSPALPNLESVKQQFRHWRSARRKLEKIPDALWDEVKKLIPHHKHSQLCAELGITYSQLNLKLEEKIKENPLSLPDFVEASFSSSPSAVSSTVNTLEFSRPDGTLLRVSSLDSQQLLFLIDRFLGTSTLCSK